MKKFFVAALAFAIVSCANEGESNEETVVEEEVVVVDSRHPEWVKSANIYEVNVRQYTESGTLNDFAKELPRLNEMGVDILWFMPIQPIGVKNRKESAADNGSYYSISEYTKVNPELGSLQDFKDIVNEAHEMGMYVVLDWVANHTAWDHVWVDANPEWYTADADGNRPIVPIDNEEGATDWTDVADLNYDNLDMRKQMIEDMKFWLTETNIDGFRCDVAGFVPNDFWQEVRPELDKTKSDIFMLAEWEDPAHMESFNMNYGWHFHHLMNEVAKGDTNARAFEVYADILDSLYSSDDIRMYFTTNHDENSWNGTIEERFGDAGLTYFVLASTYGNGMPLIYSGQEMGLNHRLSFFGKDQIKWERPELGPFYARSLELKHKNPALWNGNYGGPMHIVNQENDNILVYTRENGDNKVVVMLNFSDEIQMFKNNVTYTGEFLDWYNGVVTYEFTGVPQIKLAPFEFKVFVQNQDQ